MKKLLIAKGESASIEKLQESMDLGNHVESSVTLARAIAHSLPGEELPDFLEDLQEALSNADLTKRPTDNELVDALVVQATCITKATSTKLDDNIPTLIEMVYPLVKGRMPSAEQVGDWFKNLGKRIKQRRNAAKKRREERRAKRDQKPPVSMSI